MSQSNLQFKAPQSAAAFTGTTRARVTAAKFTDSKFGGKQVEFTWVTQKNNRVVTWMTIASPKEIAMYTAAGVIFMFDKDACIMDVTPLEKQPLCELTLDHGKLKKLAPIQQHSEDQEL